MSSSCPICLNPLTDGEIGSPESCDHNFCLNCIREWATVINTCPIDRSEFNLIFIRNSLDGPVVLRAPVPRRRRPLADDEEEVELEDEDEDVTTCEVCGSGDREDRLLLCDGCDAGYHLECCVPPLQEVPVDAWFCPNCEPPTPVPDDGPSTSTRSRGRIIPRTRETERVRARIMRNLEMTDVSSEEEEEDDDVIDVESEMSDGEDEEGEDDMEHDNEQEDVPSDESETRYQIAEPKPKPKAKRKPAKKRKTRKRKVRRRRKRRVKGRGRRRVVRRRTVVQKQPSVHSRLANKLGISPPKPGHFLPGVKGEAKYASSYATGSASELKLFGDSIQDTLASDSDGSESSDSGAPLSRNARWFNRPLRRLTQTERDAMTERKAEAARKYKLAKERLANPRRAEIDAGISEVVDSVAGSSSAAKIDRTKFEPPNVDLLDSILDGQATLHVPSKHMQIEKDGSLKVKESVKIREQQKKEKAKIKARGECWRSGSDDWKERAASAQSASSEATKQENPKKNPSPDSSSVVEKENEIATSQQFSSQEVDSSDEVVKEEIKEEVVETELVSSTVHVEGEVEHMQNDDMELDEDSGGEVAAHAEEHKPLYPTLHQSYPPPQEQQQEESEAPAPDSLEARIQAHISQLAFGTQQQQALGSQPPPPPPFPPPTKRKTLLPAPPPMPPKQYKPNESSDYESSDNSEMLNTSATLNPSVFQPPEPILGNSPQRFMMPGQLRPANPSQANLGLPLSPFVQVSDTARECIYDEDKDEIRAIGNGIRKYFEQECNRIVSESGVNDDDDVQSSPDESVPADSPIQKQLLEMNPIFLQNLQAQLAMQQHSVPSVPNLFQMQRQQQLRLQQEEIQQQLEQQQEDQARLQQEEQIRMQQEEQMRMQQEEQLRLQQEQARMQQEEQARAQQDQQNRVQQAQARVQQEQLQQLMLQQETHKILMAQGLAGLPASFMQANLQAHLMQQQHSLQQRPQNPDLAALLLRPQFSNQFDGQMLGQPNVSMSEPMMSSLFGSPRLPMVSHALTGSMQFPNMIPPSHNANLPSVSQMPEAQHRFKSSPQSPAPGPAPPPQQHQPMLQAESSEKRSRQLRFSEDVIEHSGEESRPSLTKRLRQATGGASPYSPTDLSPLGDIEDKEREMAEAHEVDMEEKLSKAELRQKRKELKLKKMLMEPTSTTVEEEHCTSAVDMQKKGKILTKFNYQLRVEEEVKQALRPFYSKKKINKDEYKDIMRRAVPKITMKKGSINPAKVQSFIEAYVKMAIQARNK